MTRLVKVSRVLDRMNFEDTLPDIPDVIEEILDSLTPDIEQDLRSTIVRSTVTDRWFVQGSFAPTAGVYHTFLAARQGLVRSLTSISYASSYARLATDYTDLADYAQIEGNGEKGSFAVFDMNLSGLYVQATYVAGLDEISDGEFESVPGWLQELAIWRAILKFDAVHPGVRVQEKGDKSTSDIQALANGIVNRNVRYLPRHIQPF